MTDKLDIPTDTPNLANKLFIEHPASVNESYLEHMLFALLFAGSLFYAGTAALIHAFIPGICKTTASKKICGMHERIESRKVNAAHKNQ